MIEHNLDVVKSADWIVDLGPEGGAGGGSIVAEGTPEEVAANPDSHTGVVLRRMLPGTAPVRRVAAARKPTKKASKRAPSARPAARR